jgi:tRNA U54 and U55 pseudouridine synthase Pus10
MHPFAGKATVQIHSAHPAPCPICGEVVPPAEGHTADAINHLLDHGYRLLRVGTQWSRDEDDKLVSHIVATLGR